MKTIEIFDQIVRRAIISELNKLREISQKSNAKEISINLGE